MSFSPLSGGGSGGELEAAVRQMLETTLQNIQISSAGGDSPKVNRVVDISIPSGFEDIMDTAVRTAVLRHMEENGMITTTGGTSTPQKGGSKIRQVRSLTSAGVTAAGNPLAALSAPILGAAANILPPVAIALMVAQLIPVIFAALQGPGGPFDRRFKRDISGEVLSATEREEKASIRQGLTLVRITSTPTFRGEAGIGQTGQVGINGIARYDNDFESFQKGVL